MPSGDKRTVDRIFKLLVKWVLQCLARCGGFLKSDLSLILSYQTESILNLPGRLRFFPTPVTNEQLVKSLIHRLHPVTCSKPLIRLGPTGDGGYLVPDDLDGIAACFSPGVNNVAGFELDCAERGIEVHLADASVQGPPINHPRFHFSRRFLGAVTQGTFVSLEEWVNETSVPENGDLMLQMDIEGFEYETLLSVPESVLRRFRIVVVEFHYLEYLFSEPLFSLYSRAFEKLLLTHTCVHIHPNNFCQTVIIRGLELLQMAEFTFLRNDRLSETSYATAFPHPLDSDNTSRPSYPLPTSFYRSPVSHP